MGLLKAQLAYAYVHETFKPQTINMHCFECRSIRVPYLGHFETANAEQMLSLPYSPKGCKIKKVGMDLDVVASKLVRLDALCQRRTKLKD